MTNPKPPNSVQIGNNVNSFTWANLSPEKKQLFIKCKSIIEHLSNDAIEEANENLEGIIEFYKERQQYTQCSFPG